MAEEEDKSLKKLVKSPQKQVQRKKRVSIFTYVHGPMNNYNFIHGPMNDFCLLFYFYFSFMGPWKFFKDLLTFNRDQMLLAQKILFWLKIKLQARQMRRCYSKEEQFFRTGRAFYQQNAWWEISTCHMLRI